MSMLIHRCTKCQHPEKWHATGSCSYGFCRCSHESADINPIPEVVPRYKTATGEPNLELCPPGAPAFGPDFFPGVEKTCACDACVLAYDDHTRATA